MAFKHSLLFLALLFLATASLSHGFILNGVQITQVTITGKIYCSSTGNYDPSLPTCPPLASVKVTLVTTGLLGTSVCATALTDGNGVYTLVYDTLTLVDFLLSNYIVSVDLSLGLPCTLLPKTGFLQAPFSLLNIVGSVAQYGCGPLSYVA